MLLPFAKKIGFRDDKSATYYGSQHMVRRSSKKRTGAAEYKKNVHCIICEITQLKLDLIGLK